MNSISRREWAAMICAEAAEEMQRLVAMADELAVISAKAASFFAADENHSATAFSVSVARNATMHSEALDRLSDRLARVVTVYLAKPTRRGPAA